MTLARTVFAAILTTLLYFIIYPFYQFIVTRAMRIPPSIADMTSDDFLTMSTWSVSLTILSASFLSIAAVDTYRSVRDSKKSTDETEPPPTTQHSPRLVPPTTMPNSSARQTVSRRRPK